MARTRPRAAAEETATAFGGEAFISPQFLRSKKDNYETSPAKRIKIGMRT